MKRQQKSSSWKDSKKARSLAGARKEHRGASLISGPVLESEAKGTAHRKGGQQQMKAEHLSRKTNFKRHSALPAEPYQKAYYDLTAAAETLTHDTVALEDILWDEDDITPEDMGGREQAFREDFDLLDWCGCIMSASPTARSLAETAATSGWSVGLSELHSGGFYLDVQNKKILIDQFSMSPARIGRSVYFRNAVLTIFIRALRDVWHEERGAVFEEEYRPQDVLMLERVRAADCDTVAILAGWELRGAGFSDVWRHLIGAEEGDMALIFTRFLERDPTALFDGSALAYAFRQWFADESRVNGSDHETLEALDDMLLDEENPRPLGEKELSARMIEELSFLPGGIVYLAGLGETICRDPFFAGLNDPINQSHLFQLVYDMEVTMVNNVPFRDKKLAQLIFPQ